MTSITLSKRVYQRTLPLLLVSIFMTILATQYFSVSNVTLNSFKNEVTSWGVVVTNLVLLYTQIMFVMSHVTKVARRKGDFRAVYESSVFIATLVLFMATAGVERSWGEGPFYTLLYLSIVGIIATGVTTIRFWAHAVVAYRVIPAVTTLEASLFVVVFLTVVMKSMTTVMFMFPQIGIFADWILRVPYNAVQRVAIGAVGVASIVMALRAFVGKEPGIVEVEPTERARAVFTKEDVEEGGKK